MELDCDDEKVKQFHNEYGEWLRASPMKVGQGKDDSLRNAWEPRKKGDLDTQPEIDNAGAPRVKEVV